MPSLLNELVDCCVLLLFYVTICVDTSSGGVIFLILNTVRRSETGGVKNTKYKNFRGCILID